MEAKVGMRRLSLLFFTLSAAALASNAFAAGSIPLGACSVFVGLLGGVLVYFDTSAHGLSILLVLITILAVIGRVCDGSPYVLVFAVTSALVGWEFGLSAGETRPFPKEAVNRYARKRAYILIVFGAASLLIVTAALHTRLQLSFGLALGLGLAALFLLGLALQTAGVLRSKGNSYRGES